jgi:hypothetical protein
MRQLRFIDLFAGLGGFHLALKAFGHQCVFASELDEELRTLYEKNFGIKAEGDICAVPTREIPPHDILCAGFPDVRAGLRQIGQAATYQLRAVPARELPLQRFKFTARLMRAAGYRGWVILIDEVELIGRYSRLQRARSYSELARWMGRVEIDQYPGLTSVGAITDDFVPEVLEKKGDLDYVSPQLQARDTPEYRAIASRAETGMRIIQRESVPLERPDSAALNKTYETLKRIHSEAHRWSPPDMPSATPSVTRPMRSYVRRWINEWDLKRLYPGEPVQTVETELRVDYTESPELEEQEVSTDDSQSDG